MDISPGSGMFDSEWHDLKNPYTWENETIHDLMFLENQINAVWMSSCHQSRYYVGIMSWRFLCLFYEEYEEVENEKPLNQKYTEFGKIR